MKSNNMDDHFLPFPFFPQPANGETVYSIFCRCSTRTPFPDKYLLHELTGQCRCAPLMMVLPGYLPLIAARMPDGHPWRDTALIVREHTALPYFIYFDEKENRVQWLSKLAGAVSSHPLTMALGLARNQGGAWSHHPRYCPICAEEDRNNLGFTWFKREHQLPGVAVCWQHETVLAQGCCRCGSYPIKGRALTMAGKCSCDQGILPLPVDAQLPADSEALLWLARQSAFLVNSSGTCFGNIRTIVRERALKHGLGHGTLLDPARLAEAIERRFGEEVLTWLGTRVWVKGQPAAWVRRLLSGKLNGQRRSPTILYLLVIGSLYESVVEFEKSSERKEEKKVTFVNDPLLEDKAESESPRAIWSEKLFDLLQSGECGLPGISCRIGVSVYQLIEEIRRCGWRVILSPQIRKKLGDETIAAIKDDLRRGIVKTKIMRLYGCSEWALTLIELDEPGLNNQYRIAARLRTQENNRARLLEHLATHPAASRSDIMNALPGVYDALNSHDKEWFHKNISKKKLSVPSYRKDRIDWPALDRQKHMEITSFFDKMLAPAPKPIQATATSALKQMHLLATYRNNPSKFPLVSEILQKRSESRPEFIRRRIAWAVEKMTTDGESISINKLRRVAGLSAQIVRDHKRHVIDLAQRLNAEINGRSFFA